MNERDESLPADPFVADQERFPEDLGDEAASQRIDEFLRAYQDPGEGELLVGWVLLTQWSLPGSPEQGASVVCYNISPGLDWFRTLGILRAGTLRSERDYLRPDEDTEDEDTEDEG